MPDFEPISPRDFCDAISRRGSPALAREFARFTVADPASWQLPAETLVHHGPLTLMDGFKPPAFNTLILGDLFVEGFVHAEEARPYDGGGLFVVIGNVECDVFAGQFGKQTFIDGNLEATQIILNAFEDSSLTVAGNLRTRFFYGWDIWANVGGRAEMEYGNGYCLPFGFRDAGREAIRPRHDVAASERLLNMPDIGEEGRLILYDLLELARAGRSPFR
jgi:hypothetical protein